MATFKIKLKDKAAFLNRMEKQGEAIGSGQIKDNKMEGYFEVTLEKSEQIEMAKDILKQSPKINTIKEKMKKLTKTELAEMVRQELQAVLSEKKMEGRYEKEKLDEIDPFTVGAVAIPALAAIIARALKSDAKVELAKKLGKSPEELTDEEIKQAAQAAVNGISAMTGK